VALGDAMVGWVDFHDPIRPGVANVVASLRARGIASWVLSGDGGPVVEALCGGLGFEVVEGDCTPQYKAKKVSELMAQGCFVAFVGDGFNDAPALGVAHLGIAVHGATSATQGAANITLQSPGVARVAFVLSLGRAARRVMRQNLGWAMAYNALAIPLAMSGQLRPAMAAVAMIFSSITVSLNSLRLHRIDQVGSPPNISK
jgi:P-type E1-E2 ATPase